MLNSPRTLISLLWTLTAAVGPVASMAEQLEDQDPSLYVVGIVNGQEVTFEDLESSLDQAQEAVLDAAGGLDLERLLERVINDTLIGQEARAMGLDEEDKIAARVDKYRKRLAVQKLDQIEVEGPASPAADEIEALYEELYRRATFWILTADEKEGAIEMMDELEAGADISALAREKSIDAYRIQGGFVEDKEANGLRRDIADLVFSLDPGVTAGPLQTALGWSVIRVASFQPADPALLAERRTIVERLANQQKTAAIRDELTQELRSRHRVVFDEDLIAAMGPVRRSDGRFTADIENPEAEVAEIGGQIGLTASEYGIALEKGWKSVRNEDAARTSARIVLNNLVDQKLMLVEALARGYGESPEVVREVTALETQILVSTFLREVLAADIEVSQEDKEDYYSRNRESFHRPPNVLLGQLTVPDRELAEKLAGQLRDGADLAWLARQHSVDQYREKGGVGEWVEANPTGGSSDRPLVEAQPGDVLGPFDQEDTWKVVQVLRREEQGLYSLDEVGGNVRQAVFQEKFNKTLHEFLTKLKGRSEIEILEEDAWNQLEVLVSRQTPQEGGREPAHGH